jgi:glucokinase
LTIGKISAIINIQTKGATDMCEKSSKLYIGIDLGGTFIKGGAVDGCGNILVSKKIPTECEIGNMRVAENISRLIDLIISELGVERESVLGVGIGSPGMIDSEAGRVVYSNNLGFRNFPLADEVARLSGFKTRLANDASVACLGEARFGAAKGKKNAVMLTLGTGVGGGIIINGTLYEGQGSAGSELGHMTLVSGGEECKCGRRGCFEKYASATALVKRTRLAMSAHPDSKMWQIGGIELADGETAFKYYDSDPYAKAVVDEFIRYLADGITSLANIFRPEVIIIGGGLSAEGERLLAPLREILNREIYGGELGPAVELLKASLENRAGTLGAAALVME